jgi:signal transduction histidine kinase
MHEFVVSTENYLDKGVRALDIAKRLLDYGVYGELNPQQHEAVGLIRQSTAHLTQLVNDLLQTTQIEAGKFRLDIVEFDLDDLISRLMDTENRQAQGKNLEFSIEVSDEVPRTFVGDPMRIYQVMANLLENGIKFTNQGFVKMRIFLADPTHWAFDVSDSGIGIPLEFQEQIFKPFQQANFSLTRQQGGYGLGLAIVQQLVGLMEGRIELESYPEKGSRFRVILPLKTELDPP